MYNYTYVLLNEECVYCPYCSERLKSHTCREQHVCAPFNK